MGDPNGSIPTVQPIIPRPMFGAYPQSAALHSVHFVSKASIDRQIIKSYGLRKRAEAVVGCRNVTKKDMIWNTATPKMAVDPECYTVTADDVLMDVAPADEVPLTTAYNIF
jgi:urease